MFMIFLAGLIRSGRWLAESIVRQHSAYGSVVSRIELLGDRLCCHGSTRV